MQNKKKLDEHKTNIVEDFEFTQRLLWFKTKLSLFNKAILVKMEGVSITNTYLLTKPYNVTTYMKITCKKNTL